jgi:hypothetical protein
LKSSKEIFANKYENRYEKSPLDWYSEYVTKIRYKETFKFPTVVLNNKRLLESVRLEIIKLTNIDILKRGGKKQDLVHEKAENSIKFYLSIDKIFNK